jgi:hypothetical protein
MAGKAQEIWETTTGGTVYVNVRDPRNPEGWTRRKVGGRGSKRITVSVEEREFNQELVQYENEHLDPFRNGTLIRVSPKDTERGENERSDAQLIDLLKIDDDDRFAAEVRAITSEVVARRLLTLAAKHTSMLRHQVIQDVVDERYRIGKTSQVVRELQADSARYADADL